MWGARKSCRARRWTRPDVRTRSGRAPVYGAFDETRHRRRKRTDDLAAWHEMLLDRFAGTPEDDLLDRLVVSPALAGPELSFVRAQIAPEARSVGSDIMASQRRRPVGGWSAAGPVQSAALLRSACV